MWPGRPCWCGSGKLSAVTGLDDDWNTLTLPQRAERLQTRIQDKDPALAALVELIGTVSPDRADHHAHVARLSAYLAQKADDRARAVNRATWVLAVATICLVAATAALVFAP